MKVARDEERRSIFARGRWGYDLLFIMVLVLLLASPFPFLRTKKEHAIVQIRRWQVDFRRQKRAKIRFTGITQTVVGPWVFDGEVFIETGQPADVHMRAYPEPEKLTRGERVQMEATYHLARTALRRFLSIYTHLTEEVFEINDVWIVRREADRVVIYFPEMARGKLRVYHVYLWGRRNEWVPESLTFQTEEGHLFTFYFGRPEPYNPLEEHPPHAPGESS